MSITIAGLSYEEYARKFGEEQAKQTLQKLYGTSDIRVAEEISKQKQQKIVEETHGTLVRVSTPSSQGTVRVTSSSVSHIGTTKVTEQEKEIIKQTVEEIKQKGGEPLSVAIKETKEGLEVSAQYQQKIPEGKVVFVEGSQERAFVVGSDWKVHDLPYETEKQILELKKELPAGTTLEVKNQQLIANIPQGVVALSHSISESDEKSNEIKIKPSVTAEQLQELQLLSRKYNILGSGGIISEERAKLLMEEMRLAEEARKKALAQYGLDVFFSGLGLIPQFAPASAIYFVLRGASITIQTSEEILKEGWDVEKGINLGIGLTYTTLGSLGFVSSLRAGIYPGMQKEIVNTKALVDTKVISQGEKGYYEDVLKTKVGKYSITSKEFGQYKIISETETSAIGETKGLRITKIQEPSRFGFVKETTIVEKTSSTFVSKGQEVYYPGKINYASLKIETPERVVTASRVITELEKGYAGVGISKTADTTTLVGVKGKIIQTENLQFLAGVQKGISVSGRNVMEFAGTYTQVQPITEKGSETTGRILQQTFTQQHITLTKSLTIQQPTTQLIPPLMTKQEIKVQPPTTQSSQPTIQMPTQIPETQKIETTQQVFTQKVISNLNKTETIEKTIPKIETTQKVITLPKTETAITQKVKEKELRETIPRSKEMTEIITIQKTKLENIPIQQQRELTQVITTQQQKQIEELLIKQPRPQQLIIPQRSPPQTPKIITGGAKFVFPLRKGSPAMQKLERRFDKIERARYQMFLRSRPILLPHGLFKGGKR